MKSCHQYGPWVKVLRPSSSYYYWKRNWLHQRKFLKSWKKFIIWCWCYLKMWLTESSWLAALAAAVIQSFSEEKFLLHLYSATWAKIFSRSHLTLTKIQSPTAVLLRNTLARTIRPHSQLLLLLSVLQTVSCMKVLINYALPSWYTGILWINVSNLIKETEISFVLSNNTIWRCV